MTRLFVDFFLCRADNKYRRRRPKRICGWVLLMVLGLGVLLYLYTHQIYQAELEPAPTVFSETDDYFAAIDSPTHPFCRLFRLRFPIVANSFDDMDIAFTLVVQKDVRQIARLLRMIHRTNNYYCIHVDKHANTSFETALRGVAKCFGTNVDLIMPGEPIVVNWDDELILLQQVVCAKQALNQHPTWKYLINLAGQDFPLRTNLELVAALKALNGSNLVESLPLDKYKAWVKNTTLPLNASWFKGSIYGAYRREFLQEAVLGTAVGPIRNVIIQPGNIMHPERFYFPTLAYNSHLRLPGACLNGPSPASEVGYNFLGKFVIWDGYNITCPTKVDRGVCVLGMDHVTVLQSVPHISANKFHADFQPEAYDAMEQWYFRRVTAEISSGTYDSNSFDPNIYANLSCSRHHL
ncbi:unnamed protein product [Mesocestoides corti]|uniref:Protein xylosyltransferase n=1 Tax=Mesocestoides corti TaxID=53468 RepID=A0A0R3UA47_MESCO|nr:unnamed protein product [Mesocestoides corti]